MSQGPARPSRDANLDPTVGAVFLETRRRGLERYLTRLVRHPLLRHSPPLVAFLSLSDHDGSSYDELVRYWIAAGPPPPGEFFAKVWHPEWNVDRDDAVKEVDRWGRFVQAVEGGGGVADVDHAVARVRSTMQGTVFTFSRPRAVIDLLSPDVRPVGPHARLVKGHPPTERRNEPPARHTATPRRRFRRRR